MRVDYIAQNRMRTDKGIEVVNNPSKVAIYDNAIDALETNGIEINQPDPSAEISVFRNNVVLTGTGGIGIQYNAIGLEPLSVNGVSFKNNDIVLLAENTRGIEMNAGHTVLAKENEVLADAAIGIYRGISLNSDYNSTLNCNDVEATSPSAGEDYGIYVSDGEITSYHCNEVANTGTGVFFTMGSMTPENFKETTFSGNEVGLRLSETATIGNQSHQGNQWIGAFSSFGAQHESTVPLDWANSEFTSHTSSGTYYPSLPTGQEFWFLTDFSGTPADDCATNAICPTTVGNPNDDGLVAIDDDIANNMFQVNEYTTETGWLAERYLYRKLVNNPNLVTAGSAVETFYNNTASSVIGSLLNVNEGMESLYDIDGLTLSQISSNFDAMSSGLENIAIIDSQLYETGIDTVLEQQRTQEMQGMDTIVQQNEAMINPLLSQRASDAGVVAAQNAGISSTFIIEQNKLAVNDIYLNTVATGILEFDATQTSDLTNIAVQCPLAGGSAVYEARSLLSLVQDVTYDDDALCNPVEGIQVDSKDKLQGDTFYLYPNPAQDRVTLLRPENSVQKGEIVVTDALGAIVVRKSLEAGDTKVEVNTSGMGKGVYLFSLFEGRAFSQTLC